MRSKGHSHNKWVRLITVPFKALGKARDLYVRSLTSCASRISYGQIPGDFTGQYSGLPRSFSASSAASHGSEDLRELIRAASARSLGHRNEFEMLLQQQLRAQMGSKLGLPKSCSVAMGRIDEDEACEFEESDGLVDKKQEFLYPRSKSYAATNKIASCDSY